MSSFKDYVEETIRRWDADEVQAELGRYRYALVRDMKKARNPEWHDALECLHGNIEDKTFWMQILIMMEIDLPK